MDTCTECGGEGYVMVAYYDHEHELSWQEQDCHWCNGAGWIDEQQ